MTIRYKVTFEFMTDRPPVTHGGTVTATTIGTCARRAIADAQRHVKSRDWDSMVFVALERLDAPAEDEVETEETAEVT